MSTAPFVLAATATTEQEAAIKPALQMASDVLGSRFRAKTLKDILLMPQPKGEMPDWNEAEPGVQPAWGLWKGWAKAKRCFVIWYYENVWKSDDCVGLILHEIVHGYDEIVMTPEMRADCLELMHAQPQAWIQGLVWAKYPYETNCIYGSAALWGINPPYKKLSDRRVYSTDLPKYRNALLG